jgi:hypothetical protein
METSVLPFGEHLIKFHGPFHLEHLIKGTRKFVIDKRYLIKEIYKTKAGGGGKNLEMSYDCKVDATHFVRKNIKIIFKIGEIKNIEVVRDGKKELLQHGRGHLVVDGTLEFGYAWPASLKKTLLPWYLTYIYKPIYWGKWADGFFYEIQDLVQHIRTLLNFEVK